MPTGNLRNFYLYLPEFYEKAGFAQYSEALIPRILTLAQQSDWIGRRVMDLACGIGSAAIWLAHEGFRVTGVDLSNEMLIKARNKAQQAAISSVNWRQQDIRALDYSEGTLDLVTCFQALNFMQSLRDLEKVFSNAYQALSPDKLFIFDMETIEGMANRWGTRDHVLYDNGQDLLIVVKSAFSYESLANSKHYIIYYDDGGGWQRVEEEHVERGYPLQAIITLLDRAGFHAVRILNADLEPFDPDHDHAERVLFVARKPPA